MKNKNMLNELVEDFINSQTCKASAYCLFEIIEQMMSMDHSEWEDALADLTNALQRAVMEKRDQQLKNKQYCILSGHEANLAYLLSELQRSSDQWPRLVLAKLEYLANKFDEADDTCVQDMTRIAEIMDYCIHEFKCVTDIGTRIIMALPDISIDCLAESVSDDHVSTMFINTSASTGWLESFAYEAIALLIESNGIPEKALDLLDDTYNPGIRQMCEDDQYTAYLSAVKEGLTYQGPYCDLIEEDSADDNFKEIWFDYLKNL